MKNVIFTDGMDNDGRVSAIYLAEFLGDNVEVIYLDRGKKVMKVPAWVDRSNRNRGEIDINALKGANVYFTDICLDHHTMEAIAEIANSLVVLDHHNVDKSIEEADYFKYSLPLVSDESAVIKVLKYIQSLDTRIYELLDLTLAELVSDRDTFCKSMVESEYLYMCLDEFSDDDIRLTIYGSDLELSKMLHRGKILYDEYMGKITQLMKHVVVKDRVGISYRVEGRYLSDLGNRAVKELDIDYYVNVNEVNGKYNLGFRSLNGEALEQAKKFGGGGHPNAAGAQTDYCPYL